jgi:hypothetical protein
MQLFSNTTGKLLPLAQILPQLDADALQRFEAVRIAAEEVERLEAELKDAQERARARQLECDRLQEAMKVAPRVDPVAQAKLVYGMK